MGNDDLINRLRDTNLQEDEIRAAALEAADALQASKSARPKHPTEEETNDELVRVGKIMFSSGAAWYDISSNILIAMAIRSGRLEAAEQLKHKGK